MHVAAIYSLPSSFVFVTWPQIPRCHVASAAWWRPLPPSALPLPACLPLCKQASDVHSTLYTSHCTLHTPHCKLHILPPCSPICCLRVPSAPQGTMAAYMVWRALRTLHPGLGYIMSIPVFWAELAGFLMSNIFVGSLWSQVGAAGGLSSSSMGRFASSPPPPKHTCS